MFSFKVIKTTNGKDIILGVGSLEFAIELDFVEMKQAFKR